MPLIDLPKDPPTPPTGRQRPNIEVTGRSYRHNVVDSKVEPLDSLSTHIVGSVVVVDYYSQVLGGDDNVSPYQPGQLGVYQQYKVIHDLEFKLPSGDLNRTFDSSTAVPTVTGEGTIYPKTVVPNVGDVIILDIGDGRAGQFNVDTAEPLSILHGRAFRITFSLARIADAPLIAEIGSRVIQDLYYIQDYLIYGKNPIIAEESLAQMHQARDFWNDLAAWYCAKMFNNEFRTFMVPGQGVGNETYDSFLTEAIAKMISPVKEIDILGLVSELPRKFRRLNVDGPPQMREPSIWDALLQRDSSLLYSVFPAGQVSDIKVFSLRNSDVLGWSLGYDTIVYSGVKRCVTPKTFAQSVDYDYTSYNSTMLGLDYIPLNDFKIDINSVLFLNALSIFVYPGQDPLPPDSIFVSTEVPDIKPIAGGDGYVLSSAFYQGNVQLMSKLEVLVYNFFQTGEVNVTALFSFCSLAKQWGRLEQFYYIPILLILLKVALINVE